MWSLLKNNHWVVKLAVAFLLVGLAFRLLSSRSTEFPNVVEAPFLQEPHHPQPQASSNLPETRDRIPHKAEDSAGKCDLSIGNWIGNLAGPLYTNESCQFIETHQNCMKNGRPDKGYLYWRWNPRDCELPQFNAKRFLEIMRNKAWALIGDSISRNHVQSLLCLLSKSGYSTEVGGPAEDGTPDVDDLTIWIEKTGGIKKNRILGFPGYRARYMLGTPPIVSSSIGYSSPQQSTDPKELKNMIDKIVLRQLGIKSMDDALIVHHNRPLEELYRPNLDFIEKNDDEVDLT